MEKPLTVKQLEDLGRVRLSESFFMRDMLYSEISNIYGMPNIPDYPDVAIAAGKRLCEELLEPLQNVFGKVSIRSAYRSPTINQFGHENGLIHTQNADNFAKHIWDYRDADGNLGALATVVVNRFIPYVEKTGDWQSMAWYIHDHLPYSNMCFYPKLGAFNFGWRENPLKRIDSKMPDYVCLTKPGMANHAGPHSENYAPMLSALNVA